MYNKNETEVVVYNLNGFEDDAKFVEIDGAKFEVDPEDATKPKVDADGKNIPFKETEAPAEETPEEKKKREDAEAEAAKSGKSLEELAKDNPELQKILDDKKKLEDDKKAADKLAEEAAEKAAEDSGKWKELAEERKKTAEDLQKKLEQKEDILGKYVTSTKSILKEVMATIPKEKQGLIPQNFSPREQLEYITKNAKLLGAKVSGKGGGVDANDDDTYPTEEAKVQAEMDELVKKENKTQSDHTKIFELSKKIKELRAASQGK